MPGRLPVCLLKTNNGRFFDTKYVKASRQMAYRHQDFRMFGRILLSFQLVDKLTSTLLTGLDFAF